MPLRRWIAGVGVLLSGCIAGCTAAPDAPSAPVTTPAAPVATPAASVTTPAKASPDYRALTGQLDREIAEGLPELQEVRAVVVSVDDTKVIEHFPRGRYPASNSSAYAHVYSVTKSVTSILVGIALDEGHLTSVDQSLAELLPKYRSKMTDQMAAITLRQLLTHTSAIPGNSAGSVIPLAAADAVESILTTPLLNDPGTVFDYSNLGAHLVTAILAEATGRSVVDYAREKLFGPLGITTQPAYVGPAIKEATDEQPTGDFVQARFAWASDRQGINSGCCFLKLTASDMVRLGELYLNHGVWHGRKIVSAHWVRDSTVPQVTPKQLGPDAGYGYLWWLQTVRGHRAFLAAGSFGQLVMVVPDLNLVIAVSTRDQGPTEDIDLRPLGDLIVAGVER